MTLITVLKIVYALLGAVATGVLIYQVVMALLSGRKKREPILPDQKHHRFALIISARNERNVIGQLLDSLMAQEYPKEFFDVYVIADNCTDNTAQVAAEHGAIVLERFNEVEKGKGYALAWFFDKIHSEKPRGYYDAYGVFDADNLVDKNYLAAMNQRLNRGMKIAVGYRDIKNPSDNWVSGAYSIYFWCICRFFLQTRSRLGMSGLVSGTGFVFRSELIADTGWNTQTITEDCEFSLMQILNGNRIEYVPDAIFYDEQPTTFRIANRQRYRWALGSIQCIQLFMGTFFKGIFSRHFVRSLDMFIYLMSIPCSAVVAIQTCMGAAIQYMGQAHWYEIVLMELTSLAITIAVMWIHGIVTVLLEGKSLRSVWKGILGWPLFLFSWTYISLFAIFYRNTEWKPIAHHSTAGIEHMDGQDGNGV